MCVHTQPGKAAAADSSCESVHALSPAEPQQQVLNLADYVSQINRLLLILHCIVEVCGLLTAQAHSAGKLPHLSLIEAEHCNLVQSLSENHRLPQATCVRLSLR